ncbi:MAG: hypothetical protein ACK56F_20525, partial [bacterium]
RKPSRGRARAAEKRSIREKRTSPQGRKNPWKMLGENQPKRHRKKKRTKIRKIKGKSRNRAWPRGDK